LNMLDGNFMSIITHWPYPCILNFSTE
jgi:hypothetical protein